MPTDWSDQIAIAELSDEPELSEEFSELFGRLSGEPGGDCPHIVLNFAGVKYLNSSHLAQLLRLRKRLAAAERSLVLCGMNDDIWSVMMLTGLDRVFRFAPDTMLALASLQLEDADDAQNAG